MKNKPMNKKGQVILLGFMLFVVVIVFALGIAFSIRQGSNNAMSNSSTNLNDNMNCTNPNNPDSTTAGCYVTDITPFIFIGVLIAIGSIYLVGRWVFGG